MKNKIFKILIALFIFCSPLAWAGDGVVAIVNNEIISKKDLEDFVKFMRLQLSSQYSEEETEARINQLMPDLINRLIEDRLIVQAAYKENVTVDPNRIKARIGSIKEQYSSEVDFEKTLASQGLSLADMELKIKEQFLMFEVIENKIRSKIIVKPQEVTDYYYAFSDNFTTPEQRQARFIVAKEEDLSRQLEARIAEFSNLEEISGEFSLPITNLGWVSSKQLKKEIADVVFGPQAQERLFTSSIEGNTYIFEILAIDPSGKKTLAEVRDEINKILFNQKLQNAMLVWMEKLESDAYIEIKGDYAGR